MELYTVEGFKIDTLQHYGIKGQKWGLRRYQKTNGTYTAEGRRRYKTEQKKADILTAEARVSSRAVDYARNKLKQSKLLNDHLPSAKHKQDYEINKRVLHNLEKRNRETMREIDKHTKYLKKVYGEDNVNEIKTDKKGVVKDNAKMKDRSEAASFATTVGLSYLSTKVAQAALEKPLTAMATNLAASHAAVAALASTSVSAIPVAVGLGTTAAAIGLRTGLTKTADAINQAVTEGEQVKSEYYDEYKKEKKLIKAGENK